LINGTPIGMEATLDESVIPDVSYFHPGLVVADLIYVPAATRLLKMAQSAGLQTVSGLGMQLFQGVSAFKMWTGHDMPIDTAKAIVLAPS
jgi:shikimate dehydrogenase